MKSKIDDNLGHRLLKIVNRRTIGEDEILGLVKCLALREHLQTLIQGQVWHSKNPAAPSSTYQGVAVGLRVSARSVLRAVGTEAQREADRRLSFYGQFSQHGVTSVAPDLERRLCRAVTSRSGRGASRSQPGTCGICDHDFLGV
jgi:hypothetical protein